MTRWWKKKQKTFRNNAESFFESQLQIDLHLSDEQLAAMPYRRFVRWIAFYKVRAEKEEAAYKKSQNKTGRGKSGKKLPPGLSEG